jgi:hypothetical protein
VVSELSKNDRTPGVKKVEFRSYKRERVGMENQPVDVLIISNKELKTGL